MSPSRTWHRGLRHAIPLAGATCCIALLSCAGAIMSPGPAVAASPTPLIATTGAPDQTDPVNLLRLAQERCERDVRDYRCVFLKQERMDGKLRDRQVMQVLYRNHPQSVYMTWIENADRLKRAVYVQGQNVSNHGEEQAIVEPAGAIARLFVSRTNVPIHGDRARKASRYPIDQFGFHCVLTRLNQENEQLARDGLAEWRMEGSGSVDGRPTLVMARQTRARDPQDSHANARLVVHLDREWLLPTAVYSYADRAGEVLLGSYVTTNVELNPGLGDEAFTF